jgi:hypothetical protein
VPSEREIELESICLGAALAFARACREFKEGHPDNPDLLEQMINYLMTELWDNCFSQSDIGTAFERAILDMPRYAAGQEKRS